MSDSPAAAVAAAAAPPPASPRADIPLLARGDSACPHYLDNAATALMPAAVFLATAAHDDRARGNTGRGLHPFAEAADEALENARRDIAAALSSPAEQLVFVPGCTAALNWLARALGETLTEKDSVLLSIAEHHSAIVPWQIMARRRGFALRYGDIDERGGGARLDEADILAQIGRFRPRVVALSHASNVGGALNDFSNIAAAARDIGAVFLVDGAQAAPHEFPNLPALGCDFYAFSAHKCHGPNGIGALWGRAAALETLADTIGGGGAVSRVSRDGFVSAPPPRGLEPGTPPISQAVGFAAAFRWRQGLTAAGQGAGRELAALARRRLSEIAGLRLLFADAAAPCSIVSFVADGVHPHDICEWLAGRGVAIRGGHLCAQPLMTRLGIDGCARASFAPYNNEDDVDALVAGVADALRALR